MNQTQLLAYCRLMIPEIKSTTVISDVNLLIILNNACTEFVNKTDALPTSTLFAIVAGQMEYPLYTYVPTFSKMRKEGCWWYNTVSLKWKKLDPTTQAYMRINFPDWLNQSNSIPQRYATEGDMFILHPPALAAYAGTNYIKIYHFAISTDMSNASHYPFSGSASIHYPYLAEYEEYLIDYVKFKLLPIVGKPSEGASAGQVFYTHCKEIKQKLLARSDLVPEIQAQHPGMLINQESFQGSGRARSR